jgi:hypothetical protein
MSTRRTLLAPAAAATRGSYQEWQMAARAAGYPRCQDCGEPIAKGLWAHYRRCGRCERQSQLLRWGRCDARLERYGSGSV